MNGAALSQLLVLLFEDKGRLTHELRSNSPAHLDVGLELGHGEFRLEGRILQSMHIDDMPSDVEVLLVLLFVVDDEEKVESRHDWRRDLNVVAKRLCAIISTSDRISGG